MLRKLGLVLSLLLAPSLASAEVVTDLAGRKVEVPEHVDRIVLGEGRYLPAIAILDRENPLQRIVGMMGEYERLDPAGYGQYLKRFPKLGEVPKIGRSSADSFSLEETIALAPQVAVFGLEGHGPGAKSREVIDALEAAGVAIVFIDFRHDPLVNTPKSIELLGRVLGRQKEAAEFLGVWHAELDKVRDRLTAAKPAPTRAFIESRVGRASGCCETMVRGMMGRFVEAAGGANIAADVVPGEAGTVSLEYLIDNPPDVYIATAIGSAATTGSAPDRIALGAGVSQETARETLQHSMSRTGIADLAAVHDGHAFAIWHHFYNSPFNVVAVQAFARWLHPDLFADLKPEALLNQLYERFQPVPLEGVYWTSNQ